MLRTKKTAAEPARRPRRWIIFLAGAGLGWALARLAGTLLDRELQAVQLVFVPLSTLAGGAAALGVSTHFAGLADMARDAVRRQRLRTGLAVLGLGLTLLLGLYLGFTQRIRYRDGDHTRSVAFLKGWSRSGLCECAALDDK